MIVDASVVVKWFVFEPLHEEARALLASDVPLFAPDILPLEVANALWLKVRRGELDEPIARRNVAAIAGQGEPELRASVPLTPRAFELARQLDHSVYDCVYLALAEQLGLTLVTADARFSSTAMRHDPDRVRLLSSA